MRSWMAATMVVAGRAAQILQQGAGRLQVHALGRLVEQQEARVAQVGLSHPKPAPLAA